MKGNIGSWVCIVVGLTTWVTILDYCNAADLTFNVNRPSETSYSKLLDDVRDKVKDKNLHYGFQNDLPVIAKPKTTPEYFYVDIVADKGTITAAITKSDVYFVGYSHTVNGVKQARILKGVSNDKKQLFTDIKDDKNRTPLSITGSYIDLERYAGDRGNVGLGAKPLNKIINDLYNNKKFDVKIDATLSLVVIQTISEAARFKYIENNILGKFGNNDGFKPQVKDKTLQKNWETTTKTIKDSTGPKIDLELKDEQGNVVWKWLQVGELVDVMGLLKYLG